MVTMAAQSASNWCRNTHTHMDRTHSLVHQFTSTQLQPRGAKRPNSAIISACWICSCFRNPPNSDYMDYTLTIFIVRT